MACHQLRCTSGSYIVRSENSIDFLRALDDVSTAFRALAKSHRAWNRTRDCRTRDAFRLGSVQRDLCTQNLDLMPAMTRAARSTTDVCQQLFADKRWNCSSISLAPRFTPDLTGGLTITLILYSVKKKLHHFIYFFAITLPNLRRLK